MAAARRGIYTMANDNVSHWLLALLASLKIMNRELPVRVIPFDSRVNIVRRMCAAFGYPLWEPAGLLARCDQIGEMVAPRDGTWTFGHGNFRRLAAFGGPFDEFIYLDADTLVLEPLTPVFDACTRSGQDIVFGDTAGDFAYNPGARREELRADGTPEWNAGIYFSRGSGFRGSVSGGSGSGGSGFRTGALGLDEMLAASQIDLAADRAIIRRDAADQSFLNWFAATRGLSCARLGTISEYGRCWAFLHRRATGLPGHLFDFDGPRPYSRMIPILHWAGQVAPAPDMPQARLWQDYHAAGRLICGPKATGNDEPTTVGQHTNHN